MDFSKMLGARTTLTLPELFGNIAKSHWIHIRDADNASQSSFQVKNVDQIADLHASVVELACRGIIFIGLADGSRLMAGQNLEHKTVVVLMRTPELCSLTAVHFLPNVKDEPRRELARLVRQHEA